MYYNIPIYSQSFQATQMTRSVSQLKWRTVLGRGSLYYIRKNSGLLKKSPEKPKMVANTHKKGP